MSVVRRDWAPVISIPMARESPEYPCNLWSFLLEFP
jgi:hypothetical protein